MWLQWLAGGLSAKGAKLAWSYSALPEASHALGELGELVQLDITHATFSEGAEAGLEGG